MPSPSNWQSVCYGNGKFVVVAYGSKAAYSADGSTWTAATLPSSAVWNSVCYGNGKFVAIAYSSNRTTKAAYSTDGITWTETTLPSSAGWQSVCYGNGKFVAVAQYTTKAAYSTDGITWTTTTLPSSVNWISVCYGNGKFVAVANDSTAKVAYADASLSIVEQLCGSGMVRVQEMSYVGTGTYGSSNPTTLTFDFVPKVVFVQNINEAYYHMYAVNGSPVASVYEYSRSFAMLTWSGKTLSFYNDSSYVYQLNERNVTYKVIALG